MSEYIPTEAFPPGKVIQDAMDARCWTLDELHSRLGNDPVTCCAVDLTIAIHDKSLILDRTTSEALALAFGVDVDFFFNLDRAWRGANP